MTRTLFDCVGDWFEDMVQTQFPELNKTDCRDGRRPDFEGPDFCVEAKTGYWDYGAQLKGVQIANFQSAKGPLIYAIGYHNTPGLRNISTHMTEDEIDSHLRINGGMHSAYLVSNAVIQRLWHKESHTAANHPDWRYFSVRPRHLNAIINNTAFRRGDVRHMPSRWYGIRRSELLLKPAPLLEGRRKNLVFGTILHRDDDKAVIDYMTKRKCI